MVTLSVIVTKTYTYIFFFVFFHIITQTIIQQMIINAKIIIQYSLNTPTATQCSTVVQSQ